MSDKVSIQPMPNLSADEYSALREDIRTRGVLVPVILDQNGRILDGNNRVRIAGELGIEYPTETVTVDDENDAIDLAITLNCARRHLSREQLRAVIASELVRRPADSDREIARRVGCDHKTVGSVRRGPASAPVGGEVPQMMSVDEAEQRTQEIRAHLDEAHTGLLSICGWLLANDVTASDVLMALNRAKSRERRAANPELIGMVDVLFDPLIEYVIDPDNLEHWLHESEREDFVPLSPEEIRTSLRLLESLGDRHE